MNLAFTKDDLDSIQASTTNLFHILRHFSSATEDVTDSILGKEYEYYNYQQGRYIESVITDDSIKEAFSVSGSKFGENVTGLENPSVVIETIKKFLEEEMKVCELKWMDAGEFLKFNLEKVMEKEIGSLGVVDLSTLSGEEKMRVEKKERGGEGVFVQTLSNKIPPPTKKLAIGLIKRKDTGKIYVTAYPGVTGGPPFPSSEQNDIDRKISEEYWSRKVFLE